MTCRSLVVDCLNTYSIEEKAPIRYVRQAVHVSEVMGVHRYYVNCNHSPRRSGVPADSSHVDHTIPERGGSLHVYRDRKPVYLASLHQPGRLHYRLRLDQMQCAELVFGPPPAPV